MEHLAFRQTGLVVGGSIAGLAAAHALASRLEQVLVVERHPDPVGGQSVVPQGAMPHVLLAAGAAALERLDPGFRDELYRAGAVGQGDRRRPCYWSAGGAVRRVLPLDVEAPMCSRALLEATLRSRLRRRSNVAVLNDTAVRGLVIVEDRVRGVQVDGPDGSAHLAADLVVDATGRAGRGVGWLRSSGYLAPPQRTVSVNLTYIAVDVHRDPADLDGARFAVVQNTPRCPRIGVALPAEGDRWQIVLGSYFGQAPALDRAALGAFAQTLPDPVIARLLAKPWLTAPRRHGFPASQRHDWHRVHQPAGFCAVGDAVASFNPLYGQGMTAAALHAESLGRCLDRYGNTRALPHQVARLTAAVTANPWQIATGADFIYEQTVGDRPLGTRLLNSYLEQVMIAAADDDRVNLALTRVQQLLAQPQSLLAPPVIARVLRRRRRAAVRPA